MTARSATIYTGAGGARNALHTAGRWLRVLATSVDSLLAMFFTAVPSASTASEEVG